VNHHRDHGQAYVAATETMRAKRLYLSVAMMRNMYSMEKFPHLRELHDFALRISNSTNHRKTTDSTHMLLLHIDQALPCR